MRISWNKIRLLRKSFFLGMAVENGLSTTLKWLREPIGLSSQPLLLTDPTWSKICAIYSSLKAMSNDPNDFEEPEGLAVADNGVLEVITGS